MPLKPIFADDAADTQMVRTNTHSPIREGSAGVTVSDRSLTNYIAEMGVVALVGLVLGLIGPFQTAALPLPVRFMYWIGGFLIAWAVFRVLVYAMREITQLLRLPDIVSYALAVPLLSALIMIAFGQLGGDLPSSGATLWLYLRIVGVGALFFALFWVFYFYASRKSSDAASAETETTPDRQPSMTGLTKTPLHDKLPVGFGAILALQVEDHYVRVHADGRSEMLLMNLSGAIAMMGDSKGLQVHRSWWVADRAVIRAKRSGRNLQLIITGDTMVPVSRANVAAVRKAGWLER